MARIVPLIALSSIALLALSFLPDRANALSVENHYNRAPHSGGAHDAVARRKRRVSNLDAPLGKRVVKRCSAKTTSTTSHSSTTTTSTTHKTTTTTTHKDTTTAQPAAAVSTAGSTGAKGKVGLAFTGGPLSEWKTDLTYGLYNWDVQIPDDAVSLGFDYGPMLWGPTYLTSFNNVINSGTYSHVFGMNEVNEVDQSNMSVDDGYDLWTSAIQPLGSKGIKLISPSTSSNPDGLTWMQSFMDKCGDGDCGIDCIAVHWYDTTFEKFQTYVTLWYTTFGKCIWVTEFACQNFNPGPQCTSDEIWSFMEQATEWMNGTPWVERYYAFGALSSLDGVNTEDSLMASSGAPNALGSYYINQ